MAPFSATAGSGLQSRKVRHELSFAHTPLRSVTSPSPPESTDAIRDGPVGWVVVRANFIVAFYCVHTRIDVLTPKDAYKI